MAVLLSESASLTARETLIVLGSRGLRADVLATGPLTLARFSRWRRRAISVPRPGVQIGTGAGGSAAARLSVDHPVARAHAARVGAHLAWHGGLTLDYLHVDGRPRFIECNSRIVEPGNAAAAGVDLPALMIALARRRPLPEQVVVGRPGVRTRSALALAIGAAERIGTRRAVARVLLDAALSRGELGRAAEVLTPVRRDPPSLVPVAVVAAQLLARPARAATLARGAVDAYAVTPAAIDLVRARA